jgi:hypothetical protein
MVSIRGDFEEFAIFNTADDRTERLALSAIGLNFLNAVRFAHDIFPCRSTMTVETE